MRVTIENILNYINKNCVEGRDDFEISVLYNTISSLYYALEIIKQLEGK